MLCKYRCIYSPTVPCIPLHGCQRMDVRRIPLRRWSDNSRDTLIYQLEFTTCLQIMWRQGSKVCLSLTFSRFKSVSGPRDSNYINNKFTLDNDIMYIEKCPFTPRPSKLFPNLQETRLACYPCLKWRHERVGTEMYGKIWRLVLTNSKCKDYYKILE